MATRTGRPGSRGAPISVAVLAGRASLVLASAVLITLAGVSTAWASAVGNEVTPARMAPTAAPIAGMVKYYVVGGPVNGQREYLFQIAAKTLGNGNRHREIFTLNEGRLQPDGQRVSDPAVINPGWVLRLPDDADGPGVMFGIMPEVTQPSSVSKDTTAPTVGIDTRVLGLLAVTLAIVVGLFVARRGRPTSAGAADNVDDAESAQGAETAHRTDSGRDTDGGLLERAASHVSPGFRFSSATPRHPVTVAEPVPTARASLTPTADLTARADVTAPAGLASASAAPPTRVGPADVVADVTTASAFSEPQTGSEKQQPTQTQPLAETQPPAQTQPRAQTQRQVETQQPIATQRRVETPARAETPSRSGTATRPQTPTSSQEPADTRVPTLRPPVVDPGYVQPSRAPAVPLLHTELRDHDDTVEVRLAGSRATANPAYTWVNRGQRPPTGPTQVPLGEDNDGTLFVDLAASPDVITITGPVRRAQRLATKLAGILDQADVSITVVGDALGGPLPGVVRTVLTYADVNTTPRSSGLEVVFGPAPTDEEMVVVRRLATLATARAIVVMVGDVRRARWSFDVLP